LNLSVGLGVCACMWVYVCVDLNCLSTWAHVRAPAHTVACSHVFGYTYARSFIRMRVHICVFVHLHMLVRRLDVTPVRLHVRVCWNVCKGKSAPARMRVLGRTCAVCIPLCVLVRVFVRTSLRLFDCLHLCGSSYMGVRLLVHMLVRVLARAHTCTCACSSACERVHSILMRRHVPISARVYLHV
jgi:hypothetical protein